MTTTMNADSASARRMPPRRPGRVTAGDLGGEHDAQDQDGPVGGGRDPAGPGPPRQGGGRPGGKRHGEDGVHEHQSCSSLSWSRSKGPSAGAHRRRENPQDHDDEQDVQGCPELDQERHPGGEQERDERDAVVDQQQPGDRGDRLAPRREHQETDEHGGHAERREAGGGAGGQRGDLPARQVGHDDQHGGGDRGTPAR